MKIPFVYNSIINHERGFSMGLKIQEPSVPDDIQEKIRQLHETLEEAQELYNEILDWYDHELKTYDPSVNALMELSDPGTGCVVEGISYHSIMEGLSILQTSNEKDQKLICQPAGKHDG